MCGIRCSLSARAKIIRIKLQRIKKIKKGFVFIIILNYLKFNDSLKVFYKIRRNIQTDMVSNVSFLIQQKNDFSNVFFVLETAIQKKSRNISINYRKKCSMQYFCQLSFIKSLLKKLKKFNYSKIQDIVFFSFFSKRFQLYS